MLDISPDIKKLDDSDIGDNLLHYEYNVKHLLSLIKKGIDKEDPQYLSSYRSFEGEVYENYLYEKLVKYAEKNDYIKKFILKGFHQNKTKSNPNTLSISEKQQIVYRTKSREISEFDAMFITQNNELYFVEMTLVKNVLKLRKRLRKKKALLEIIFPNYEIKSLIILNEGATGTKQFPSYCKVWFTKEFSSTKVLEYILNSKRKLKPKIKSDSKKMIEAHTLKLHPFRYYNTMSWITKTIRAHKKHILDLGFLMNPKIQRYHDLYNKLYIGYMSISEAKKILNLEDDYKDDQRVVVAIEKKHSDEIVLTYYIQFSRKKLYLYSFNDEGEQVKEKKDPYGITVTEVFHISKMMDNSYELNESNIKFIKKLLSGVVRDS
jgi:hypothetical protein